MTAERRYEEAMKNQAAALAHMEAVRYEDPEIADEAWRAYCEANDEVRAAFEAMTAGDGWEIAPHQRPRSWR